LGDENSLSSGKDEFGRYNDCLEDSFNIFKKRCDLYEKYVTWKEEAGTISTKPEVHFGMEEDE
jgi:hypothetical protein